MKSVSFTATKNGRGYVVTGLVPANHSQSRPADKVGLAIAGGLLFITVALICLLLLAV